MKHASRFDRALRSSIGFSTAFAVCATLWTPAAMAQQPAPAAAAPAAGQAAPVDDVEQLVARIALYPDDLVALVLPASTNPLQIVQAERFLAKRKTDKNAPIDEKWDDAVKSLVNYPEVISAMSGDLDWTAALGEAVVEDQSRVLEAIQVFRRKAQAAGNLKSDDKQVVVVEKEIVTIVPADPQVVYVPQYDPTSVVVYGGSAWGYYPTPYPSYYYPYAPGAALATGLIWGAAIGAVWGGNRYGTNYGGNANININRNTNINTGNVNVGSGNRPSQGGGSTGWKPDKQRGQVSSSVGASTTRQSRVGDARPSTGAGSSLSSRPSAGTGASVGTADRSAARAGGGPGAGAGAFDGYSSGRQTQMDSSRGASSRQSATASSLNAGAANRDMGMANRNSGAQAFVPTSGCAEVKHDAAALATALPAG